MIAKKKTLLQNPEFLIKKFRDPGIWENFFRDPGILIESFRESGIRNPYIPPPQRS